MKMFIMSDRYKTGRVIDTQDLDAAIRDETQSAAEIARNFGISHYRVMDRAYSIGIDKRTHTKTSIAHKNKMAMKAKLDSIKDECLIDVRSREMNLTMLKDKYRVSRETLKIAFEQWEVDYDLFIKETLHIQKRMASDAKSAKKSLPKKSSKYVSYIINTRARALIAGKPWNKAAVEYSLKNGVFSHAA